MWEGIRCCVEVRVGGCECARGVGGRVERGRREEAEREIENKSDGKKDSFQQTAFSNILIVLLPGKPAAVVVRISDDVIMDNHRW